MRQSLRENENFWHKLHTKLYTLIANRCHVFVWSVGCVVRKTHNTCKTLHKTLSALNASLNYITINELINQTISGQHVRTQTQTMSRQKVDTSVKQEDVIQAVIIADSFTARFAPITHFKPRVSQWSPETDPLLIATTLTLISLCLASGSAAISESTASWVHSRVLE